MSGKSESTKSFNKKGGNNRKVEEAKRQIDYLTKKLQAIEQEIAQLSEEYRKLTGKNE